MKLLTIRLARFGDIVLLLPALHWLKAQLPGSHLTFLTDERWGELAGLCPSVDEVLTLDRLGMRDGSKLKALKGILALGRRLRRGHFDAAIDCHGFRESSLMAWWTGAPRRLGLQRFDQPYLRFCFNLPPVFEDKSLHVSEMFLRLVRGFGLEPPFVEPRGPALVVPPEAKQWASAALPASPYAALFIDAPVSERRWPEVRFRTLAREITRERNVPVVVIAGPGRDTAALKFDADVRVFSGLSIPHLAAAVGGARVLVGNDTGPLHLGPALGVKTLGLFSVGLPQHFRPHGPSDEFIHGNPIASISTEVVLEGFDRLWTL